MKGTGAATVIEHELRELKGQPYQTIRDLIGHPLSKRVLGVDGAPYNVEIVAAWDDKPEGAIRVMVSVDNGGWRAFFPLTDSVLIQRG